MAGPEPAEVAEESPADELLPQAPPSAGEPAPARLPGADEAARIAAEMAAVSKKGGKPPATSQAESVPAAPAPQAPEPSPEDDLELIEGVGPIYAKRFREMGITTYEQVAAASYSVLEKVTRGNLERVVKEDWRGQARRLASQK
jgi:predicted flap endonuclease-1-like 5' DNA nuclease